MHSLGLLLIANFLLDLRNSLVQASCRTVSVIIFGLSYQDARQGPHSYITHILQI